MITAFYVLLFVGIGLICVEVFLPGMTLGIIGSVCLLGSVILAFMGFKAQTAVLITVGMVALLTISFIIWLKLFPKSSVGKAMTLDTDGRDFKSADSSLTRLIGKTGETMSELRPAGFAMIDGQRLDVVTEGELIPKGQMVRIVTVEGNRVIVRKAI